MLRHLIDEVGVDVNIGTYWPGSTCSTPLSYITCYPEGDATQLIWFLLERGGDPNLVGPSFDTFTAPSALQAAVQFQNTTFLKAVKTWQLRSGRYGAVDNMG
jgi:hypothetical protein